MIKNRRSVRRYLDKPVPKEMLQEIFDCAHLAPTGGNAQQWLFGCITDKELLSKVADATLYGKFIKNVPACFAVFYARDHHLGSDDGCAATMNIIYGAAAHGLGTCWVWGDNAPYVEEVRKILGVPEQYRLISLVPVGYPAEAPEVPKKPVTETSFWNTYQ
jgi:nitroreductase